MKSPLNKTVKQTQFLGEELVLEENNAATARFQVIPCGLEKTVSYGSGTAKGPTAIIEASQQLERLFEGREPICDGIYTHAPIDCTKSIEEVMDSVRQTTKAIANAGQIPVTLGGEHSLSYGAVMGVADALKKPIGLVHIDAHADFREAYQGNKHSHASVMHLLAKEGLPMASFGVRALSREEDEARRAHGVLTYDAAELVRKAITSITLPDDFPQDIYVSFDLDGLDPSVLPATGTPVPGGLGYYQALDLVRSSLEGRRCVGIDVVELAPITGQPHSNFTAAQITYALMGMCG